MTRWLRRKNHSALTNLMRKLVNEEFTRVSHHFAGCVKVIHVVNVFVLQFV